MHENYNDILITSYRRGCFHFDTIKQFFNVFLCNLKELKFGFVGNRFNSIETMFSRRNSLIYNEITKNVNKKEIQARKI